MPGDAGGVERTRGLGGSTVLAPTATSGVPLFVVGVALNCSMAS
jgi:hypothetical protein